MCGPQIIQTLKTNGPNLGSYVP